MPCKTPDAGTCPGCGARDWICYGLLFDDDMPDSGLSSFSVYPASKSLAAMDQEEYEKTMAENGRELIFLDECRQCGGLVF